MLQTLTTFDRYVAKTPGSKKLYERALQVIPGGVTHDTRYLQPHPLYIARAAGAHKWDVDGNQYVDYIGGHGALLLGHNDPFVIEAVQRTTGQRHALRRRRTSWKSSGPSRSHGWCPAPRRCASPARAPSPRCWRSAWPGPTPRSPRSFASSAIFTAGTTRWPSPPRRTSTARRRRACSRRWPPARSSARPTTPQALDELLDQHDDVAAVIHRADRRHVRHGAATCRASSRRCAS